MNNPPTTVPSLPKLYWRDFTIRRGATALGMGLMIAIGIWWMAPTSSPHPSVDLSFEIEMGRRVPPVALGLAAIGAMVILWRYLLVRKILTEGATIKGVLEKLDRHATRTNNDEHATVKANYRYSYWATVRYTAGGREHRVTLKLPNSGSTYGLTQGGEVDLSVLESKPAWPLIRIVYLGRW